ncbi:MAG: alpha-glucan family phosphorylase, partial [Ignavibacteria bacterium]
QNDFYNQPMELVKNKKGEPVRIALDFPGRQVHVQVWKLQVGRLPLYLLDTDFDWNNNDDRKITRTLYGGDNETRIQQEFVLGIGGIRILHEMGVIPLVCHMNEGHSAFLGLERLRILQNKYGLSHLEARNINFYSNIFTTHTPVPAGIDIFPKSLVEKYFGDFYRNELHISDKEFYRLGTIEKDKEPENFNMAHLAMNMAGFVNGVSRLHGDVSKHLWVEGFKGVPFDEIPIDYVTNGVHMQTHLSNEMRELLVRYGGENFFENIRDKDQWGSVAEIPDEELWRTHERRRERLVAFARQRLQKQILARGGSRSELNAAKESLDPGALTIGFARRFATYKRATLIFRDIERLASLLCDPDRPVQLIIAGKAHPKDDAGKELIQEIIQLSKEEHLRKRIVFIENYDMNVARYMVQGCDIWLNNPRRPYEASGTSGMKVIANGGLNFSVLDGWWDEAYNREVGWRIGDRESYHNEDYQDEIEARLIYETLEKEIIPLFYQRSEDKLPREWIKMMKNSMMQLGPVFNTDRMLQQYTEKFYLQALDRRKMLMKDNWKLGKDFTVWKEKVYNNWHKVRFVEFGPEKKDSSYKVGESYGINAVVELGDLTPNDVEVQIYYGDMNKQGRIHANQAVPMKFTRKVSGSNSYKYKGEIPCVETGNFGYTLRILPKHDLLINKFELGIIRWAE